MKLLNLDDAEENLLHWLVQCCLSDGLLARSGLTADQEQQYLEPVRTLDAKLMEIARRSGKVHVPDCGESVGNRRCTRPAGHPPGSNGKPGHFWEMRADS